jgi:hypothetical protein
LKIANFGQSFLLSEPQEQDFSFAEILRFSNWPKKLNPSQLVIFLMLASFDMLISFLIEKG